MKPEMRNRFVVVATLFAVVSAAAFAQSPQVAVDGVGVTVSDMDRAVAFYSALTFQKISDREVLGEEFEHLEGVFGARMRIVRMQLGDEHIDLIEYLAPRGRPIPVDSHSNDLWFQHIAIVVRDMDQAFAKLRELKVQFVSTAPQTLPASISAAAGIKAFYFRDPDQHNLEIIYFPLGKGDPRWQEKKDKLFLGIDHTAIGFLEYLAPRDGRPRPADIHANDIVHWQTMVVTDDVDLLAKKLADTQVVSSGVIVMPKDKAGFSKGVLVSDPDGHDVLLIQR